MRKEPAHRSEMVSQLLFGEYAETAEEEGDFVKVTSLYDGYEGWVQSIQLMPVPPEHVRHTDLYTATTVEWVRVNGLLRTLPFGIPVYESGATLSFGKASVNFEVQNLWDSRVQTLKEETLAQIASVYLETPYLWGGRSIYGIDCSGLAQQVFRLFGKKLLRDAYQQAAQGEEVPDLENARPGDLAFFHNEKGRITHVGIVWKDNKIFHAAGKVRIDQLDKDGVLNLETGKRTHHLNSIRRYF